MKKKRKGDKGKRKRGDIEGERRRRERRKREREKEERKKGRELIIFFGLWEKLMGAAYVNPM